MSNPEPLQTIALSAKAPNGVPLDIVVVPDPEHAHLIEVWEPLNTKAPNPNLAQPYCCYANTVIFYVRPYTVRPWHYYWDCNGRRRAEKPGHSFEKWDEIETTLRDAVIEYEGRKFRCYNGRVVWKHKRWWMKRDARPVTQERKTAIYQQLATLLDECFAAINTSDTDTRLPRHYLFLMKLLYGYQNNGKFIIATTDHLVSLGAGEPGESVIEVDRATCQKIAKHMQFGKKGDIRTLVVPEQKHGRD